MIKKIGLGLLAVLILNSCSTAPTEPQAKPAALKAPPKAQKEYREAVDLYHAKKTQEALKKLSHIVQAYPNVDLANESYFLVGEIFYEQADFFKAYRYWMAVVDSRSYSEHYAKALVGAAQCQSQLGHGEEALALISKYKVKYPEAGKVLSASDLNLNAQALELSSKLKLPRGMNVDALREILLAKTFRRTPQDRQNLQMTAEEMIRTNFSQAQLQSVVDQPEFTDAEAAARFRIGVLNYEAKSWPAAKAQFDIVTTKFPNSEYALKAQQYHAFVESQERIDSNTIGVILPLTGKYSAQGYKVLRGIEMAAGVFGHSGSPVKLAVVDSEGNPEVVKQAVDRLVTEDHVVAIIGDIAAKTAQVVSQRAQELGVPNITLSQKQGLTEIGNFIFRNNLTPDMQMRALVKYAMEVRGYKKFAIIYSNDAYGTEYASAFWDYVRSRGGKITAAQTYAPNETDFRHAVQRLVGTYYFDEDRGPELKVRLQDWKKEQTKKGTKEKSPKDILPPIVDFDAIFIPDSPKALGQIAPMLSYNDVDKIPLIGTNLWNTSQTLDRAAKFVDHSLFIDEFFTQDTSSTTKKFTADFQNQFGYSPDVFEIQGFDSAQILISVLQTSSISSRNSMRENLARASRVPGALGFLNMTQSRDIEKNLIPLTVRNGQIVKADNESP